MDIKDVKLIEVITVVAIVLGPIFAVQAQKIIEKIREKKQRKLYIFRTLMATRAARVSQEHVQALNMIDIEFYGKQIFHKRWQSKKEKDVVDAWKEYLDHLNTHQESLSFWVENGHNLFTKLLQKIADDVGYEFDNVLLKKGVYWPKAHSDNEEYFLMVREGIKKIISGELSLPVRVTSISSDDQKEEK